MKWYDEIAKIVRELYEKSGRIEGRDLDNWLKAERIVLERYNEREKTEQEAAPSPKKKSKTSGKKKKDKLDS